MTEQNQRLNADNQPLEPTILTPSHKLIKRKLCQLQNKAYFFEGQLNPLVGENQKLKAQLTLLNKSVIASTDLLRSLLPIGSCENKRLKLELANLQEISHMIKEDWEMMEDQIQRKNFAIEVLQNKIAHNKEQYEKNLETFKIQTDTILHQKNLIIQNLQSLNKRLQNDLQTTKEKCQKQISDLKAFFKSKVDRVEQLQKQMHLYNRQVQSKYRDYEKTIQRMKIEISSNLAQFQQSKKNLREIYEKLMTQKLQEQAEGFNSLLRTRQEERERLVAYYEDKQQEMQRYLNEKSDIIQQMKQHQTKQKEQLEKSLQSIAQYRKTVQQMEEKAQSQEMQITQLKHSTELILQQMKDAEQSYLQKQHHYQQQLNLHLKNRSNLQNELNTKISNLQKQKQQLQQQFNEQSQKLKQTEKSLATAERRFGRQLEDQQQKWNLEKHMLDEKVKELQLTIEQKQTIIQQQIASITELELKHSKQIRVQKETLTKELQDIKNSYQNQLTILRSQTSQQFAWLKKQNQRILSQERTKNNQQMQAYQQELNLKLRLKEEQFNSIKANLQEQILQTMMELKQRQLDIQELQLHKYQNLKKLQEMKLQHQLQVKKMQDNSQKALKELQKQCEQQKKKIQQQMINQLMEFQTEMQKKSMQYQTNLQKIQTEMMNEINMLKSSNALQQLQAKYLSQITSLKKQHQQQLITMQEKQKQSQQSLVQEQKRKIEQLIQQYEEDMTRLAKRLQSDIENLNSQLFQEQKDHEITKMTRQEKIKYLSKKINELKIISEQKENQILQLQLDIQAYKKEQARMKEIIEERVNERKAQLDIQKNEFMRQCQASMQKNRLQAQRKVSEIQRDRLQHSQSMFEKFNQLKQLHEEELQQLEKKYSELQKLFAERPSRAEDLSKIKQLIEIKSKMDLEIKTYHKKVQHANEIVKYLNLELQNYKDTYDMFGPNDDSSDKPVIENVCESPIQSIMKLKKFNYKINTQGSQSIGYSSQHKYQTAVTPKITNNLRISNESPSFREFQLYPGTKLNESQTLIPQDTTHQTKISYNRRSPQIMVNNRIKKASSIDKSGQIVLNAENFLKLIGDNSRNGTIVRQNKSNDRRAYRKSKPRRLNTLGIGNSDIYSLARRQSIDQESPVK